MTTYIYLTFVSSSFLDDVSRIAARNYEPSDDDVLRARLRTVGVQEYKFKIEKGSGTYYVNFVYY
jgi:guanine nucleotide-binding protein alpha-1 subunit